MNLTKLHTVLLKPKVMTKKRLFNSHWPHHSKFFNTTPKFFESQLIHRLSLFHMYLSFANGSGHSAFKIHAYNRLLFMANDHQYTPYINIQRFHKKWLHSYSFLMNLFFWQTPILMYSSKYLKDESLSFNWSYSILPYSLFKYAAPYFFIKDVRYGAEASYVYKKLSINGVQAAFVSDIVYHKKSLFNLRKYGMYTMGLVPYSASPWVVHYSIPAASSTIITQYFFIKLIMYIRQQAEYQRFTIFKNLWHFK
jgi:hypothetical protein